MAAAGCFSLRTPSGSSEMCTGTRRLLSSGVACLSASDTVFEDDDDLAARGGGFGGLAGARRTWEGKGGGFRRAW